MGLVIVFLVLFFEGIIGTFTYHRLHYKEDSNYRAASNKFYFIGLPILILILTLFGVGTLFKIGFLPSISKSNKPPQITVNKQLWENYQESKLYLSSVRVINNNLLLELYFTNTSKYYREYGYSIKIDNIYVQNYIPVKIEGIYIGIVYDQMGERKFTILVPSSHDILFIRGIGERNYNTQIDLREFEIILGIKY